MWPGNLLNVAMELLFALARVREVRLRLDDTQHETGRLIEAVVGDARRRRGIIVGDRDLESDLGAVAELPLRGFELGVYQRCEFVIRSDP